MTPKAIWRHSWPGGFSSLSPTPAAALISNCGPSQRASVKRPGWKTQTCPVGPSHNDLQTGTKIQFSLYFLDEPRRAGCLIKITRYRREERGSSLCPYVGSFPTRRLSMKENRGTKRRQWYTTLWGKMRGKSTFTFDCTCIKTLEG